MGYRRPVQHLRRYRGDRQLSDRVEERIHNRNRLRSGQHNYQIRRVRDPWLELLDGFGIQTDLQLQRRRRARDHRHYR